MVGPLSNHTNVVMKADPLLESPCRPQLWLFALSKHPSFVSSWTMLAFVVLPYITPLETRTQFTKSQSCQLSLSKAGR